jgi:hypothetical protein
LKATHPNRSGLKLLRLQVQVVLTRINMNRTIKVHGVGEAKLPDGGGGKIPWLNRTVLGIGLASLFSDWSHETATTVLPAFLATMGVAAAWLGLIEGVADGLSSFAKMASGFYTDRLMRRKPIAVAGYVVTAQMWKGSFAKLRKLRGTSSTRRLRRKNWNN